MVVRMLAAAKGVQPPPVDARLAGRSLGVSSDSDGVGAVIQGDRVLGLGEKQPALDDEPEGGAG